MIYFNSLNKQKSNFSALIRPEIAIWALILLPFLPNQFAIIDPFVKQAKYILKLSAFVIVTIGFIRHIKKYRFLDVIICLYILLLLSLFASTVINSGSFYNAVLVFINTSVWIFSSWISVIRKSISMIHGAAIAYRITIYANLLTMLVFPNGIMQESTMFGGGVVKYWFMGMPNSMSNHLVVGITLMMISCFLGRGFKKSMALIDIAVVFTTLIFAPSATAKVGITIFVILVLLNKKWTMYRIGVKQLIAVITFNLLLVFLRIQNLFSFIIVGLLHKSTDLSTRVYIWDKAIEMISIHPIVGYGLSESMNIVNYSGMRHAHNSYLQITLLGGVLASIILLILTLLTMYRVESISLKGVRILLISSLCSYMTLCITEVYDFFDGYFALIAVALLISKLDADCKLQKKENMTQ